MTTDLNMDRYSLNLWRFQNGESNRGDIDRAKQMLPVIIKEELTEKQREYLLNYLEDCLSVNQIAKLHGVHQSTVSRTLHRAIEKIFNHLRYTSVAFTNTPPKKVYLAQRTSRKRRGGK